MGTLHLGVTVLDLHHESWLMGWPSFMACGGRALHAVELEGRLRQAEGCSVEEVMGCSMHGGGADGLLVVWQSIHPRRSMVLVVGCSMVLVVGCSMVVVVVVAAWILPRGALCGAHALLDRLLVVALVPQLTLEVVAQCLERLAWCRRG